MNKTQETLLDFILMLVVLLGGGLLTAQVLCFAITFVAWVVGYDL